MKTFIIAVMAFMFSAGIASAETGSNATFDQRCYNTAYQHFDHYQGGVKVSHAKQCEGSIMPPDWGDPTVP